MRLTIYLWHEGFSHKTSLKIVKKYREFIHPYLPAAAEGLVDDNETVGQVWIPLLDFTSLRISEKNPNHVTANF